MIAPGVNSGYELSLIPVLLVTTKALSFVVGGVRAERAVAAGPGRPGAVPGDASVRRASFAPAAVARLSCSAPCACGHSGCVAAARSCSSFP